MAHLSLYRKFRPSTFEQMVRQEHVVTVLRNQIAGDSVGHAYLFCGPVYIRREILQAKLIGPKIPLI